MIKKLTLFILISLLTAPQLSRGECSLSPNYERMDDIFYGWLNQGVSHQPTRVAIFPFRNGSAITHTDDVALTGLQVGLFQYLSRLISTPMYHPFSVWQIIGKDQIDKNISDQDILKKAKSLGATHAVYGLFQKQSENKIRYFVKLASLVDENNPNIQVLSYNTEAGPTFFNEIATTVRDIMVWIGGKKLSEKNADWLVNNAPSYEAFRYYTKGMVKSKSYNELELNIAKAWFEKSFSLSYHYTPALYEKARVNYMLAMMKKESGQDPSLLIAEAGKDIALAKKINKSKKENEPVEFIGPYRWEAGFRNFTFGYRLMQKNNSSLAYTEFEKALKLIPESGLVQFYYGKTLSQLAKPDSNKHLSLSYQLNPCLK